MTAAQTLNHSAGAEAGFGLPDERQVRDRLRAELPKDTFKAQPRRILWALPLLAMVVGGITAILTLEMPWWGNTLVAILVGQALVAQAFLSHEVLHGALGMSRRMQNLHGWIGFGPMLVTPEFWRRWHNVVHHGNTNSGDLDPDSFGTMRRYKAQPGLKKFVRLAPGARTIRSLFFYSYSFIFHAQLVLWKQTKRRKAFKGFDRNRALVQTVLLGLGWIALAVVSGPLAVFTVVIPLAVANTISQGYISTNHFLRPQTPTNNPLDNSMSLKSWRWLDPLHFRFSHHVEHHLFPKMGSNKAPRVRAWLEREMPDRYVAPTHVEAVKWLYRAPKVYLTPTLLVNPDHPERAFDIVALQPELQGKGKVARESLWVDAPEELPKRAPQKGKNARQRSNAENHGAQESAGDAVYQQA